MSQVTESAVGLLEPLELPPVNQLTIESHPKLKNPLGSTNRNGLLLTYT